MHAQKFLASFGGQERCAYQSMWKSSVFSFEQKTGAELARSDGLVKLDALRCSV